MEQLHNSTLCRICKSPKTRLVFICNSHNKNWPIWECLACDVQFIKPVQTGRDANLIFYEKLSESLIANQITIKEHILSRYWNRRLGRIRLAYQKNNLKPFDDFLRVCDVGCSTGNFLAHCPDKWEKYGVELSPSFSEYASSRGIIVHNGLLETAHYPANHFDLVTMYAMIEHVDDPKPLIQEAYRIIRPNGILVIMTGNYRSWQANLQGQNWTMYTPPEHQFFFSQKSLNNVVLPIGFQDVRWDYDTGRGQWSSIRLFDILFERIMFTYQIIPWVHELPLFTAMYGYYQKTIR